MKITAIDTKKKGELALIRVSGYARVSVDTSNSAHSLEAQSAFLKRRITSTPGWVDEGVFIDLGITARRPTDRGSTVRHLKDLWVEVMLAIT